MTGAARQRRFRERQAQARSRETLAGRYVLVALATLDHTISLAEADATTRSSWVDALRTLRDRYCAMRDDASRIPVDLAERAEGELAALVVRDLSAELCALAA